MNLRLAWMAQIAPATVSPGLGAIVSYVTILAGNYVRDPAMIVTVGPRVRVRIACPQCTLRLVPPFDPNAIRRRTKPMRRD